MKIEVAVLGSPLESLCGRKATANEQNCSACWRAQQLCESRGGRPGLPVPNSPYDLCGRKARFEKVKCIKAQELCESRGGRPGPPAPNSAYGLRGRKATLKKFSLPEFKFSVMSTETIRTIRDEKPRTATRLSHSSWDLQKKGWLMAYLRLVRKGWLMAYLRLVSHMPAHTSSIAFRLLPPNYVRTSYAAEGHSVLSPRSCQPLGKVSVLIRMWKQHIVKHAIGPVMLVWRKHEARPPRVKKDEFRLDSNDLGFICVGVSNVGGYKRIAIYNLNCLLNFTAISLSTTTTTNKKPSPLADSFSRPMA